MTETSTNQDFIKEIIDSSKIGINDGINSFLDLVYKQLLIIWAHWWLLIIIVLIIIIGGVIVQINMIREGGPNNRLPSWFNSLVGRLLRIVIFLLMWFISFKIWKADVLDEIWRVALSALAAQLTWLILHSIGFWPY